MIQNGNTQNNTSDGIKLARDLIKKQQFMAVSNQLLVDTVGLLLNTAVAELIKKNIFGTQEQVQGTPYFPPFPGQNPQPPFPPMSTQPTMASGGGNSGLGKNFFFYTEQAPSGANPPIFNPYAAAHMASYADWATHMAKGLEKIMAYSEVYGLIESFSEGLFDVLKKNIEQQASESEANQAD